MLNPVPLSTYLFVTIIRILLPQYARTGTIGLLVLSVGGDGMVGLGSALKEPVGCFSPSSMVKSLFFSSAMMTWAVEAGCWYYKECARDRSLGRWGQDCGEGAFAQGRSAMEKGTMALAVVFGGRMRSSALSKRYLRS